MKLKFKIQSFQTDAVNAVADCFIGQMPHDGLAYAIDPGQLAFAGGYQRADLSEVRTGFRNAPLLLSEDQILANIQNVQRESGLPVSASLIASADCPINLDIEMETGTGKTYCYIKTIFELNKRYGWTKFIIVVPSIAIREGVSKSLAITADHFLETYGKKARFFTYNSKQLHQLENFSSDAGINVMVINIQAFNATGKDNLRIYEELDDFQSRRPIDVISANTPVLILDEPQKMEGKKTLDALKKFKPLMILRYSATHKTQHNKVYRLDALDAYNQKLVKKIAVRGISTRGMSGTSGYLYLEGIEVSRQAPVALLELEIRQQNDIARQRRRIRKGDDLFALSNELDQYHGYVVSDIDARTNTVEFTNGIRIMAGEALGDIQENLLRRIQIREAVRAHLEKERSLFPQGIKVLSLFFIDEVVKYRDYDQGDHKGVYARWFEEEYNLQVNDFLEHNLGIGDTEYREYLQSIVTESTHQGYFSIDKKKRMVDPDIIKRGTDKGLSDDVTAYDLILKDKERLLSLAEPVRFIFSHSALREGWDNPNVFVMCMLKHSDNTISRRQEVGRGLRLCVNQQGDRIDDPATVHDTNILTVVASESYSDFVSGLQKEISESLTGRPQKADMEYFLGRVLQCADGSKVRIDKGMANDIWRYLVRNDYIDNDDVLTETYRQARKEDTLAKLPATLQATAQSLFQLVDGVDATTRPDIEDDRIPKKNPLNDNFKKKEFQALWNKINHKAVYRVDFDSAELIQKCIQTLNSSLHVTPLQYTIRTGVQRDTLSEAQVRHKDAFTVTQTNTKRHTSSVYSSVRYDLLGKLSASTGLTRKSLAAIMAGIHPTSFDLFRQNPESFINEAGRLINEQKAGCIIERLSYDQLTECYDSLIFTEAQSRQDLSRAGERLRKHIYDYAVTDSKTEQKFVQELDSDQDVVVYAKLPKGFFIPTPVGNYNPDWAIAFREGSVKHVYFVAETKGCMEKFELRAIEDTKIECARKYFHTINKNIAPQHVHYDVVDSYDKLMEIVAG